VVVTAVPPIFPPATGFTIVVAGGRPPYTVTPLPSPPNPPGVGVDMGPPIHVTVPEDTPSGTVIRLTVTDSSTPPQISPVMAYVA
jgi:hypothetical protein